MHFFFEGVGGPGNFRKKTSPNSITKNNIADFFAVYTSSTLYTRIILFIKSRKFYNLSQKVPILILRI